MKLRPICSLCLSLIAAAGAFNLAPKYAQVYRDPEHLDTESHFGYTVALYQRPGPRGEYRLLVGAPKANSTLPAHVGIIEPGVLYDCSVTNPAEPCSAIELDPEGDGDLHIPDYTPVNVSDTNTEMRDHAWIGGALDVQDRPGGDIVTCGPRWKNRRWGRHGITQAYEDEDWNMNGICYRISDSKTTKLLPLVDPNKQVYYRIGTETVHPFVYKYQYGGAGLSAHFVQNQTELLISAPGAVNWKGLLIRYRNQNSAADIHDIIKYKVGWTLLYENFGYAIATGVFNSSTSRRYTAVGTPRSSNIMAGRVYFLEFNQTVQTGDESNVYKIVHQLQGLQTGEYFGAALCTIDVNGDGLDDLLVGAPMFSQRRGSDEGVVYVFMARRDGKLFPRKADAILEGSKSPGGRFGTSVSNIGDINGDGYDDVAVGAPYEPHGDAGNGSVYIYHGGRNGFERRNNVTRYSQRITVVDLQHQEPVRGFGVSVSRGVDVDDNLFKDIAVGAYDSKHAVLIRSQPVITFQPRLISDTKKLDTSATNFTVHVCLKYEGSSNLPHVDAVVKMTPDPSYRRAQFVINHQRLLVSTYNITLSRSMEICTPLVVRIANLTEQFYTRPIEIHMEYWVNRGLSTSESFNKSSPAVNPRHPNSTRLDIYYSVGCDGNVCRPDLSVVANFSVSPLVVGAKTLMLDVGTQNVGELAFLAMANVTLPSVTRLVRLPSHCAEVNSTTQDDYVIKCLLKDYFKANTTVVLELELEAGSIPEHLDHLDFSMSVYSDGNEQSPEDNSFSVVLPLKRYSDISIIGHVNQSFSRVNLNEHLIFSHTYHVQNFGPSPLSALVVDFDIPVSLATAEGRIALVNVTHPSLSDDFKSINCSTTGNFINIDNSNRTSTRQSRVKQSTSLFTGVAVDDQQPGLFVNCTTPGAECMKVHCEAGPFTADSNNVLVSFQMRADMRKLGEMLDGVEAVFFSSVGAVSFTGATDVVQMPNDKPDTGSVQSEFLGNILPASVPLWIIAVAVAVGLLLLIIIVAVCTRCGFFTRQKKEDLNKMMAEGPGAQAQEEQELLGD